MAAAHITVLFATLSVHARLGTRTTGENCEKKNRPRMSPDIKKQSIIFLACSIQIIITVFIKRQIATQGAEKERRGKRQNKDKDDQLRRGKNIPCIPSCHVMHKLILFTMIDMCLVHLSPERQGGTRGK